MRNILIVVTSADQMGSSPHATGYWFEEVAAPYWVFRDAGFTVDIASPRGGTPPRDEESNKDENKGEACRRFEDDPDAMQALTNSHVLSHCNLDMYDAVFFAGGHGTMTDFPVDPDVRATVETFYAHKKPLAAVCHGPACFMDARKPDGNPLIAGHRFTCFTNEEEHMAEADHYVPFALQSELEKLGGHFSGAGAFSAHSITDKHLITGQNPASGAATAQAVVNILYKRD